MLKVTQQGHFVLQGLSSLVVEASNKHHCSQAQLAQAIFQVTQLNQCVDTAKVKAQAVLLRAVTDTAACHLPVNKAMHQHRLSPCYAQCMFVT